MKKIELKDDYGVQPLRQSRYYSKKRVMLVEDYHMENTKLVKYVTFHLNKMASKHYHIELFHDHAIYLNRYRYFLPVKKSVWHEMMLEIPALIKQFQEGDTIKTILESLLETDPNELSNKFYKIAKNRGISTSWGKISLLIKEYGFLLRCIKAANLTEKVKQVQKNLEAYDKIEG
jgi:hypothetical protein